MSICNVISYPGQVAYGEALAMQYALLEERLLGKIPDTLMLVEHPPTITLGRGSDPADLLTDRDALERRGIVIESIDRGGEITYHGPGQLVGYPILDLNAHGRDLHLYLRNIEEVIVEILDNFDLVGEQKSGLTGVWVNDRKIAAIGIKVRQWTTMHGFAINRDLDLTSMRSDFVPCGIREFGVTSLAEELRDNVPSRKQLEEITVQVFARRFNLTPRMTVPVV
jgi:lipoate-protein ligase B